MQEIHDEAERKNESMHVTLSWENYWKNASMHEDHVHKIYNVTNFHSGAYYNSLRFAL